MTIQRALLFGAATFGVVLTALAFRGADDRVGHLAQAFCQSSSGGVEARCRIDAPRTELAATPGKHGDTVVGMTPAVDPALLGNAAFDNDCAVAAHMRPDDLRDLPFPVSFTCPATDGEV